MTMIDRDAVIAAVDLCMARGFSNPIAFGEQLKAFLDALPASNALIAQDALIAEQAVEIGRLRAKVDEWQLRRSLLTGATAALQALIDLA